MANRRDHGGHISHLQHDLPPVHVDLFPVRVLDGWIVALNPDILDELGCEAAFADTTSAKHNNVVFSPVTGVGIGQSIILVTKTRTAQRPGALVTYLGCKL